MASHDVSKQGQKEGNLLKVNEGKKNSFNKTNTFMQKVISPEMRKAKYQMDAKNRRKSIMMNSSGRLDMNKYKEKKD